jgi:hypothetical protein
MIGGIIGLRGTLFVASSLLYSYESPRPILLIGHFENFGLTD